MQCEKRIIISMIKAKIRLAFWVKNRNIAINNKKMSNLRCEKMKETTLREILKYHPCEYGLKKLLVGLKCSNPITEQEKDLPIKTLFILENNGYDDCLWALRCFSGTSNWYRFKADVAESVLHYYEKIHLADNRPRLAIEASRNLADNLNDSAARSAADFAARSADFAARFAARSAADFAARSADFAARSAADSAADSAYSAADSAYSAADSAYSAAEQQRQVNIEILKKYIV